MPTKKRKTNKVSKKISQQNRFYKDKKFFIVVLIIALIGG